MTATASKRIGTFAEKNEGDVPSLAETIQVDVRFPPIAHIAVTPDTWLMIDFKSVWLPQIIQYADLVSSAQLEAQWLGQIEAATSVTDPDELHEQIFDDLDAETIWAENRHNSGLSAPTIAAIDGFLAALLEIDETDARSVVTSEAWATAKRAAHKVVANVR